MDELTDTNLKKPLDKSNMGTDALALRELVGFLNNPNVTGASVPPEAKRQIEAAFNSQAVKPFVNNDLITPSTAPSPTTEQQLPQPSNAVVPPRVIDIQQVPLGRKLFFTGRLCAGKDFVANKIGASIYGLADPIYSLAEYLFEIKVNANEGKDKPGIRAFMQAVGQFGRNEVNAQYPYTIERSMFNLMIRSLANQNCLSSGVEWGMFGLTPDLWIDGLLSRAAKDTNSKHIVVTNARFENEYKRLSQDGFQAWHVVCSPQTWTARLAERGLNPNSPEVKDTSEKLASDLNADLTKKLSAQKGGNKMRVVWSDSVVSSPSSRLYTVEEFVSMSKKLV